MKNTYKITFHDGEPVTVIAASIIEAVENFEVRFPRKAQGIKSIEYIGEFITLV